MSRRTNCVLVRTCVGMYFVCFSSEPQPAALLLLFNMCTRDICFHCSMPNTRPHYATASTTTTAATSRTHHTNTHRGHTCTHTLSFRQLCEAQMRGCGWAVLCVCVCVFVRTTRSARKRHNITSNEPTSHALGSHARTYKQVNAESTGALLYSIHRRHHPPSHLEIHIVRIRALLACRTRKRPHNQSTEVKLTTHFARANICLWFAPAGCLYVYLLYVGATVYCSDFA